ncbi:MAG: glutaredoxin family protein [Serratia liquefaciens]|nr:glutaredoxin family protein [Serratia liquefaciens]
MAGEFHPQVVIYTTPTCSDCQALKCWLQNEGIAFEERDLSNPEMMAEAKARTGMCIAPTTQVGAKTFYSTYHLNWLWYSVCPEPPERLSHDAASLGNPPR